MAEQRKDSRSAQSLKVKYKSTSVDEFVLQFGTDVSRGGIFIKTKSPLEAGALLKLELQLSTAAAVIAGIGRVAWRRAASQDPARPAGMGIKFIKLEPASQAIVERIVAERGAEASRFDQTEGAELARASLEPPAPTPSLKPERISAPTADGPATVRPPAPIAVPAAAVPSKQPVAKPQPLASRAQPLAGKPLVSSPAAAPAPKPAPESPATLIATATSPNATPSAATRPRIAPAKATIPSGLFATSSLVQQPAPVAAPIEEKRTSFFPPAPAPQPAPARGGSTASGQLNAPRSSSGSVSSPLHRPGNSRAPSATLGTRAPSTTAAGPKGVFGGAAPASPLAGSTSGLMRPATEVSGVSTSSLLPDRSADEVPTAAVPRPPGGRGVTRPAQAAAPAAAPPSVLDSLSDDLFSDNAPDPEGSFATSVDGMFATLEPVDGMAEPPPPARASSPRVADRVSPAPARSSDPGRTSDNNGRARDSASGARGLAAAEAADVDNLFAGFEDNDDATTDEVPKPGPGAGPASAVFTPGSARPSLPPIADDLTSDDAFGEADLLGGEDKGAPPFGDDDEYDDESDGGFPAAAAAASEPPMLRLAEPNAPLDKPEAKRSPALMIGLAVLAVLLIAGGAVAFLKPDLLVKMGLVAGDPPPPPPAAPKAIELPAQPMIEPAAAPVEAAPGAQAPATAAPVAAPAMDPGAERVKVNVTSLPRGADVRVGGALQGQTPTNVDLPVGREINVTVSAQGHAAQGRLVTAAPGMDPLRFKLEPLPYVLVVTTTPPEAELAVGSVTSVSPAPLALGHVSSGVDVAVTKKGYRRTTRNVRLDEFSERDGVLRAEIQVSLSPMPGAETEAAPSEPAAAVPSAEPAPSSSSTSRRRRSSRSSQGAPAPPEPDEVEAAPEDPAPEPQAEPEAAEEPAKEPGAPPPPPALPTLP